MVIDKNHKISTYNSTITNVFSATIFENGVYLIIESEGKRIFEFLKENSTIEKLSFILSKRYYDFAYEFAQKENFPNETLVDISKTHGDYLYDEKVISNLIVIEKFY